MFHKISIELVHLKISKLKDDMKGSYHLSVKTLHY